MKNAKEVKPILTAIFCLNQVSENKNVEIAKICDYAFQRLFGVSTALLILACHGQTYEAMTEEVQKLLEDNTNYQEELK